MVAKAPAEHLRDVKELVNQGLGLFGIWKRIVIFRDQFNHVVGRKIQAGLKRLGEGMTAGQNPPTPGSPASDGPDSVGVDMIHCKRADDPADLLFYIRRWEIFHILSFVLRRTIANSLSKCNV